MGLFLLTLDKPKSVRNGITKMLVSAEDIVDAKALALGYLPGFPYGYWAKATISSAITAKADYESVRMRIRVYDTDGVLVADATSAVGSASDDVDDLCAKMVTALNATAAIANAAYSTPNLTVASGSGGDDLGDHRVVATLIPAADEGGDYTDGEDADRSVSAIFDSITDQGVATAALAIAMETAAAPPKIHFVLGDIGE